MKRAGLNILLGLAICCGASLTLPADGLVTGDCEETADAIVKAAKANDINKISVLGFSGKGGVQKSETDYISETISAYLAGRKKPVLIERAMLERIQKETRLSPPAGGNGEKAKAPKDLFSVDAVVTGTVFAVGKKLQVLTRLVEVRTGRVLLAAQSELEREWASFAEIPDTESDWDNAFQPLPPSDLRDAVSDPGGNSCADRKLRLSGQNSELVDAKALYWAAKMKEPGFNMRSLSRNPGTEIADPEVKAKFYRLLGTYYNLETTAPPSPDKVAALTDLIEEEARFHNECGFY